MYKSKFARAAVVGLLMSTLGVMKIGYANEKLVDRQAIEDAITQYAYRWDGKDAHGFVDLFTEDVVIERWMLGEMQSRLEGRTALLEYAQASHGGRLADRQTRHHMSGIVFNALSARTAETENMVLITHQIDGEHAPRLVATGIYRNSWRKTAQGWKISKRVLYSDRVEAQKTRE